MDRDDLIGRVAISKAGRDEGKHFIVMDVISSDYVQIADGKLRTQDKLKKKKLRHLHLTDIIAEEIKSSIMLGELVSDSTIRKFLQLNDMNKEV